MSSTSGHRPIPRPRPPRRGARLGALLLLVLGLGGTARAAEPDETRHYQALARMLADGLHAQVERDATNFVAQFPHSTNLPAVYLLQARARLELGHGAAAVKLLQERAAEAGPLAADYAFWTAVAFHRQRQWAEAAAAAATFLERFPESPRRLEAAVLEAAALTEAGDLARARARLSEPDGPFQSTLRAAPDNPWAARGSLHLARLQEQLKDYEAARQTLTQLTRLPLPPPVDWERRLALAGVEFAAGRPAESLALVTNLWTAVTNQVEPALLARASLLEGRAFAGLEQWGPALAAFERALAPALPAADRRLALARVLELAGRPATAGPARAVLERFLEQQPRDALADTARLGLGRSLLLEFRQLAAAPGPAPPEAAAERTNLLQRARARFEQVLTNQPPGPEVPLALLYHAWTFWEEGPARLAEALEGFREATLRLPPVEDQARARFQWAECQLRTGEAAGAATNFWLVATSYVEVPLPAEVRGRALLGVVRAALETADFGAATTAAERLRSMTGQEEWSEEADLLIAEAYLQARQPEPARAQYEAFLQRHPRSARIPEVRLAIGHAFEQRGDYGAALSAYASWLANYATNQVATGLLARATFDLARVTHRVDPGPGSLALLTNFVARFPDDPNAPLAQYLVADQYINEGDYARAELAFLDKVLDPARAQPGEELPYRARLMAGKVAVYRQAWQSARDHFDWILTNGPLNVVNSPIPEAVVVEAYLLRGDLFILEPPTPGRDPLVPYAEALNVFTKVVEHFPTNVLTPRAWGRIGDCNLQLATVDPGRYDAAAAAYRRVIESDAASDVRSLAEVGLGIVLGKQADLKPAAEQAALQDAAMTHFLNVLYGRNLRPGDVPDPRWVRQAGLEAGLLAEVRRQWDVAAAVYKRLVLELPQLGPALEKKIEELLARARVAAGPASPP